MSMLKRACLGAALIALAACSAPEPVSDRGEIDALALAITALDPGVDPIEATRAAEIAFSYTYQLALEYEITDPPLVHNTKVNLGLKPRGLCWHWAEDMEARLNAEGFETLDLHRAIANADSNILIDHSTALISAKGDTLFEGIVLDPWRYGGRLFWDETADDTRYDWVRREEVLAKRRAEIEAQGG